LSKQSILIIGAVWVEPNSSAAGSRMLQLIELFLKQHWHITFASTSQKNTNAFDLKAINVVEACIELNNPSFDRFIQKLQPDIVLFDRFMMEEQFGWRVAEYCPSALRILDTEDLHFLRKTRHQQLKKGVEFTSEALLNSDDAKREIASILRCDLSLIISTYEMKLLDEVFKIDKKLLYYLPFLLDKVNESQAQNWKSLKQRNHFVFIGNFYHKPNVDAIVHLKRNIWSIIRVQLPKAEIHVYGAYMNQQIQELHHKKDGFIIKGFAENAQEVVMNAKVVLAPSRFGAGIKGKLTEAMLCGTPSVTSSIGAEGMHDHLPWNGCITDDPSAFAEKAIQLYRDEKLWNISQNNGIEIINHIYNKENLSEPFIDKILSVQKHIEAHRTQNFLGSLLQLNTLKATKYMSKWIEVKSK
jgi:glycosyltransferase involved in cell wall biosynthesis